MELRTDAATVTDLIQLAEAVLACELDDLPPTASSQLATGWLRAAHAQILSIAALSGDGAGSAIAPNVRAFAELAIRIVWLHELRDRATAMPGLVREAQRQDRNYVKAVSVMGLTVDPDHELLALDLGALGNLDIALDAQVRQIVTAAAAANHVAGIYMMWYTATQHAHATARLAIDWAQVDGGELRNSEPMAADWTDSLHLASVMLCGFVARILVDEGAVPSDAKRFLAAAMSALSGDSK